MSRPRIAVLPGDGIGSEVSAAALAVLDGVGFEAEYVHGDVGWEWWCREGDALPPRTIDILRACDCALFGAITSKPESECEAELDPALRGRGLRYSSPIVRLRQLFELHTAVRPCRAYPGNPLNVREGIDIVVFRENTEGLYGGIEWNGIPEPLARQMADGATGHPQRMQRWFDAGLEHVALSTRFVSRRGCERIIRAAFGFAASHGRRSVTLVEKPNVLRATGGMMVRAFREVARDYPGVEAREANIDAACMQLVTDPRRFDVIVAENMFGDIVSDLGAGLVGGLGFTPSANLGDTFALFEPTHGSAPDIAGRGIANPIAMILSAAMMARWLGARDKADAIEHAIASLIADGLVDTPDVRGPAGRGTTASITDHILNRLARIAV
jgi:3-isopropylmalate dehydrogenase